MIQHLYLLIILAILFASVATVCLVRKRDIITIDEDDQEDDEEHGYQY